MTPFTTAQRLGVMLCKTSVGFDMGCLQGQIGPASCPLPPLGHYAIDDNKRWKIYRISNDVMVLADCFSSISPKTSWARFIARAHGVLLRRLGKCRVIYLLREQSRGRTSWHSNINLVTGVSQEWLDSNFNLTRTEETCVVAGNVDSGIPSSLGM